MSKLETNTTNLQSILETINNLPEAGGGSGGGSVETCTLGIGNVDYSICGVTVTQYINGEFVTNITESEFLSTKYKNVVVGSAICIFTDEMNHIFGANVDLYNATYKGTMSYGYGDCCQIYECGSGEAVINFKNSDGGGIGEEFLPPDLT